ncbi:MAG: type II toxin-antitoxin system VapC family toxin [Leptolyngbyaceae cyanobacterium CAN_BIN12]|nr:type II toxin-antitoxin system VapC family toxin [Leptolyngbyaceae cyanobacterium CAN_BIN12]
MTYLFDSNILIYHLNGELNSQGRALLKLGLLGNGTYSIISKIEVLGFQQPSAVELQARQLFSSLTEISLTSEITDQTIALRKLYKIKLPDAIIAATAIIQSLQLVTRNSIDFARITGLSMMNPFEGD